MNKEDIYIALAEKYGWGPDFVSSLTLEQQYIYLRGPKVVAVQNMEEYNRMFKR